MVHFLIRVSSSRTNIERCSLPVFSGEWIDWITNRTPAPSSFVAKLLGGGLLRWSDFWEQKLVKWFHHKIKLQNELSTRLHAWFFGVSGTPHHHKLLGVALRVISHVETVFGCVSAPFGLV